MGQGSENGRGTTPRQASFGQPAEWAQHRCCWLAWPPPGEHLWAEHLEQARQELGALCAALAGPGGAGERLRILVQDEQQQKQAREALGETGTPAGFHRVGYGDIWLRDTGPVFLKNAAGERACACFAFNGWAGRYVYPGDDEVSREIALESGLRRFDSRLVFEGGAVEVDGQGTCIAARQCLLDPGRNPGMEAAQVEDMLREMLGVDSVLWLSGSLKNDHTDGHADTLARFIAPGRVMCMQAADADDPNAGVLQQVAEQLSGVTDATGRELQLTFIPSPGLVLDHEGQALPASYLNFFIANRAVVVPTFGSDRDRQAVELIARAFPDRRAVGLPAHGLLHGGGAFHCVTLAEPL
jgi:agmatine deiminase